MAEELSRLGRYELSRVLGHGAMGVVYEGLDPRLNRKVAVKTILKSQLVDPAMSIEYSTRFIREAQAVARLNHPNIVTVFDFGEENEVAFLVMEFIRGRELNNFFNDNTRFELREIVRLTSELLDALEYAHQAGVVHRDVKPANVMIDSQRRVKLTDFGIARLIDGGGEGTHAGTIVGTPSYMAPEQIQGLPVGPQTDLFAVGVILYQFLTGRKPFTGGSQWEIQKKIIGEQPPPPSSLNPILPPGFDTIVYRALAKKAADRYGSAHAFKLDLQRALAGERMEDEDVTRAIPGTLRLVRSGFGNGDRHAAGEAETRSLSGLGRRGGIRNAASDMHMVELEFWRSIKDSRDPEEFELYLKQFPGGMYADLARSRVLKLGRARLPPSADATAENDHAESSRRRLQTPDPVKAAEAQGRKADDEIRLQKEAEAKRRADEREEAEARRRAVEAEHKAQEAARLAAEEDAKRKLEVEMHRAELLARRQAEAQKRQAEEDARRRADEERRNAEAERKRQIEEDQRRQEERREPALQVEVGGVADSPHFDMPVQSSSIAMGETPAGAPPAVPRKRFPVALIVALALTAVSGIAYFTAPGSSSRISTHPEDAAAGRAPASEVVPPVVPPPSEPVMSESAGAGAGDPLSAPPPAGAAKPQESEPPAAEAVEPRRQDGGRASIEARRSELQRQQEARRREQEAAAAARAAELKALAERIVAEREAIQRAAAEKAAAAAKAPAGDEAARGEERPAEEATGEKKAPEQPTATARMDGPTAKKLCLRYLQQREMVLAAKACNRARDLGENLSEAEIRP